jgi:transcriptional regulator with XRE-family HTH domain
MTTPTRATYAEEIRTLRKTMGWTQRVMAAQLGLRSDSLSRYERGTRQVPEPVIRLARRLARLG